MIRRRCRPLLPRLAHWFGIRGADLEHMPDAEILAYVEALADLPPIGATYLITGGG